MVTARTESFVATRTRGTRRIRGYGFLKCNDLGLLTMVSKISRRRWSRDNYQFAFVAPALDLISLLRGLTTAGNETNALCILLVRYMRGLGQTEVPLHLCSTTMRCRARILEKVNVLHYTPLWRALESLIILMKNHNVSMSKQSASYLVSNHCFMVNGM